jgi:hypothetical protein
MDVERQQGGAYQPFLFEDWLEAARPGQGGEARSLSARCEEPQSFTASDPARALTVSLIEEVTRLDNLNRAYNQRLVSGSRFGESARKVLAATTLTETAGYDEYVRWCGRTAGVTPPPTRFLKKAHRRSRAGNRTPKTSIKSSA